MTVLDAFDLAACDDAQPGSRAAAGDAQARHESFERYLPLARRLALRYRWSGEPPDDMIQVASLALLKIVDRWDPEMGYALSSYAMPTVLGDLRHYSRDATWIVRPPRGLPRPQPPRRERAEEARRGAGARADGRRARRASRAPARDGGRRRPARPPAVGDRSGDRLLAA